MAPEEEEAAMIAMPGKVPGESVRDHELEVVDPRSVSSDVEAVYSSPLDALERGCCCCCCGLITWTLLLPPVVALALVATAAPMAEAPAAIVVVVVVVARPSLGLGGCDDEESTWLSLLRLALTIRSYMFHVA